LYKNSDFSGYADDGLDVVYGSTIEECDKKLKLVILEKFEWYRSIGLSLNLNKSEIIGIGYSPAPVKIDDMLICLKQEITFLGIKIQSDLKWSSQVSALSGKIRSAASRIRIEGRHLTITDRRMLYMGWIQSQFFCNGLVVLPTITQTEQNTLQTSLNAGIRAIVGLPKYGFADISAIRSKLNIPSIEAITEYSLQWAAWKKFHGSSFDPVGISTRSKANKLILHPDQRGHRGKMYDSMLTMAWNRIPLTTKSENKSSIVKRQLKSALF